MDWRAFAAVALLVAPALTLSGGSLTSLQPEEAYPHPEVLAEFDPFSDLISKVQRKLYELGFDPGPVNGDFGARTQAALGQFQLFNLIPVSGSLDDATLAELGIERTAQAGVGATSKP